MKNVLTVAAIAAFAGAANANVVVSEIHGSTAGTDAEYIEIYNDGTAGNAPIDISNWSLAFYDSDTTDADFGTIDFQLDIPAGTVLAPGDIFLAVSPQARSVFPGIPLSTFGIGNDSIENDSYTAVFRDASSNILEILFTVDPGEGAAQANIDGNPVVPTTTFGPDGTFLAPGYYRTDAAGAFTLTDFGNGAPNNPLVANYPAVPAPGAIALAAIAGLASRRRRA
ncbi:MAG: lamin tail domain-containing protein [Planctomycetota bacterium]